MPESPSSTSADLGNLAVPLGPPSWAGAVRKLVFGISTEEVRFARRGFIAANDFMQQRLEGIGLAFVSGYHAALQERSDFGRLAARIAEENAAEMAGFAYEGAGMGLAIVDQLSFGRRWQAMVEAFPQHIYLILVGAGWAMARLYRRGLPSFAAAVDDHHWPLIFDGYGFHQAYFSPETYVRRQQLPPLRAYALRGFDQGIGRSLFFVEGGSPERVVKTLMSFSANRRPDLWSGLGLAATYAGGIGVEALENIGRAAAADGALPALCQGSVFAAAARERAGNTSEATRLACSTLCRMTPAEASQLSDKTTVPCPPQVDLQMPAFEAWRRNIAAAFPEKWP